MFWISLHMEKSTLQSRTGGGGGGVFLLIFIDIVYSKWSSTSEKSERDIFSACPGGGVFKTRGKNYYYFFFVCIEAPCHWGKSGEKQNIEKNLQLLENCHKSQ